MSETIFLYNNGIKHWNRNEINEAKQYMDRVLSDFIKLDTYDKKNLIKFYININEIEKATKILKYMLYNNDDLLETISCILTVSEKYLSEEDLFFIERISIIKTNIELNLMLSNAYLNKGLMLRAYEIVSNTVDYIENTKDIIDKDIYYKLILILTEIEYNLNNFAQARFQIKKLIYIPVQNSIKYHEKIIYWSVVLGNLNEIISNDNWNNYIKNIQSNDLNTLVAIWSSIYNKEISYGKYKVFKNTYIYDDNLRERANILNIYIKKCMKDESWKYDLKKINPVRCYLIMIMYYEYMVDEKFNKEEIRSFFDEFYEYHYDIPQIVNLYSSLSNKNYDKSLSDIDIQFIGGANKIGGSCILIRYKNTNILLDAGANINENEYYPDFTLLEKEGITLKDIDYLIISHAHLDHTGSVPYIYKENKDIKILTTDQTKNIMRVMLEDTARISSHIVGIFDKNDVKNSMSVICTVDFEEEFKINDEIKITLYKAGHILGAASILVNINGINLLYTGDYCLKNQNTVEGLSIPKNLSIDVLITETTYANIPSNFRLSKDNQEKLLLDSINRNIDKNGVVLIPAFAVGRAQEIILAIKKYYKNEAFIPFNLYVDGKVVEICDIYERNQFKGIYGKGVSTVNEKYKSDDLNILNRFKGSCIIASSGMLNKGSRSEYYANALVEDKNSAIFFSGYLDEESPGRKLLQVTKNDIVPVIEIEEAKKEVKCNVGSYKLSAHANKEEILQLITSVNPKHLFLVHGDTQNEYKYLGDRELGNCIYQSIDTLTRYIKKLNIYRPVNGDLYKL